MASVKKGDMVVLEYTGRLANSGQVFDTTDEETARKHGAWDERAKYGPKHAVVGTLTIMPGIEEALPRLQIGKEEELRIEPGKAYGRRNPNYVRMMPQKGFAKQGVKPEQGMMVWLDGAMARVKSITSGRVVVDFNHPLAGEPVIYKVKLLEVITDEVKKATKILFHLGVQAQVSRVAGKVTIVFKPGQDREKVENAKGQIILAVPKAEIREE